MKKVISTIIILALLLAVAAPALAESKVYSTGSANIRSGPGLDYSSLGSVAKGTALTYKGKTSTDERGVKWYKVSFNGKSGWISSKYASLKKSDPSPKPSKGNAKTTGQVNLRSGPGLDYSSITTIPKGTELKYLGSTSTDERGVKWYKVSYDGKTGWISSKYSNVNSGGGESNPKPTTNAKNKVTTTGQVNLRSGPGTGYKKVVTVQKGSSLKYLGKTSTDSRGVKWYKVSYDGKEVWISSKYAKLKTTGSGSTATAAPTATPAPEVEDGNPFTPDLTGDTTDGIDGFSLQPSMTAPADYIELSDRYQTKLIDTAVLLGLGDFQQVQSEVPNQYYNEALTIAGDDTVAYIRLNGEGYTIYGVCVGMDIDSAKALMTAAGLRQVDRAWVTGFEHPAGEDSAANVDGYDSCINLYTDQGGKITELDWSTYTS